MLTFAADLAASYAGTLATTMGVDSDRVAVTGVYRRTDPEKLDLRTLNETCTEDRRLGVSRTGATTSAFVDPAQRADAGPAAQLLQRRLGVMRGARQGRD